MNIRLEQSEKNNLLESNSVLEKLKTDVNLFKVVLTNFELYVLKLFLKENSPKTIRDIQLYTIRKIFNSSVFKDGGDIKEAKYKLFEHLILEGYGTKKEIQISRKEIELANSEHTIEKEIRDKTHILKNHSIKCPSYELLQLIIQSLEKNSFLKQRERDSKSSIYYILNPDFYLMFKHKFEDILVL